MPVELAGRSSDAVSGEERPLRKRIKGHVYPVHLESVVVKP